MPELPVVFTVDEAAARLKKGRTSTWGLIRSGELDSFKIGGRRLVSEAALAKFIRAAMRRAVNGGS